MGTKVVVNPKKRHPLTTTYDSDVLGRKLYEVRTTHQSTTGSIMCYVVGLLLCVDHFCSFSIFAHCPFPCIVAKDIPINHASLEMANTIVTCELSVPSICHIF